MFAPERFSCRTIPVPYPLIGVVENGRIRTKQGHGDGAAGPFTKVLILYIDRVQIRIDMCAVDKTVVFDHRIAVVQRYGHATVERQVLEDVADAAIHISDASPQRTSRFGLSLSHRKRKPCKHPDWWKSPCDHPGRQWYVLPHPSNKCRASTSDVLVESDRSGDGLPAGDVGLNRTVGGLCHADQSHSGGKTCNEETTLHFPCPLGRVEGRPAHQGLSGLRIGDARRRTRIGRKVHQGCGDRGFDRGSRPTRLPK